jgi:hypothetical protein
MKKSAVISVDLKKEILSVALSGLMMVVVAMLLAIAN